MSSLKILHNVTEVGKSSFGLGQVSLNLCQAQAALGHDVKIWCLDNADNIKWASETSGFPLDLFSGFNLLGPRKIWLSTDICRQAFSLPPASFDIVHQHGIWTGVSMATLEINKRKNIPTIIAPHGSLNPWALKISHWKKKIALIAYERENLTCASCLHATSENEIADFRNFGLNNPIAYIENGIQEKQLSVRGNEVRFREQNSIAPDKRILLFLSRISPKKGLTMLVEAINAIRDDFSEWQLIIAGIDEFNHQKDIESLINLLKLKDRVKIIGPLFGQSKADAFAAAELFILPSYSEGSPMVVLDSLASGVPVITTKASTWSDLADYNCGWWTDISTQAISLALSEAVSMPTESLLQMGGNAKSLIAFKYTWSQLAQKTVRLYDWLLGRDEKPDFVLLD